MASIWFVELSTIIIIIITIIIGCVCLLPLVSFLLLGES